MSDHEKKGANGRTPPPGWEPLPPHDTRGLSRRTGEAVLLPLENAGAVSLSVKAIVGEMVAPWTALMGGQLSDGGDLQVKWRCGIVDGRWVLVQINEPDDPRPVARVLDLHEVVRGLLALMLGMPRASLGPMFDAPATPPDTRSN